MSGVISLNINLGDIGLITDGTKDLDSPFAVAEVGTRGSFVEGLLVRLKVQGSDQCFLQQTARAVLGPEGWSVGKRGSTGNIDDTLVIANYKITKLLTATCTQCGTERSNVCQKDLIKLSFLGRCYIHYTCKHYIHTPYITLF